MTTLAAASLILREGVGSRAFPAASAEVGTRGGVLWTDAVGTLGYDAAAPPASADTIFDLASLTKVICTTTLVMRAVDEGLLRLDDPVGAWIPEWRGADREEATIRDLLSHCAGLTAHLPFYRDLTGRAEFQAAIATSALEYAPRTQAIYTDLGFMLVGFILEEAWRRAPAAPSGTLEPRARLAPQFQRIASYLTGDPLTFTPPRQWRERIAPTEHDTWRGRTLRGEVHDQNTWALGGVAGHAGLFGTAAAVGAFARAALHTIHGRAVLARPETMRAFIERTAIPGSSRALGWDTMKPTSSCGARMSPTAIGHTGFTGTSLWIDWERDLYVVLLTNRVHPTWENTRIQQIRPRFHDAVVDFVIANR